MSNRYLPDTWLDALSLPVAMLQASTEVYLEDQAPDARLLFAALVLVLWLLWWAVRGWRHAVASPPSGARCLALSLLTAMLAATGLWLWVSGNGRYGVIVVMLAPFVGVALLRWIFPGRTNMVLVSLLLLIFVQLHFLHLSHPQDSWAHQGGPSWREVGAHRYPENVSNAYRVMPEQGPVAVVSIKSQSGMTLLYEVFGPQAHYLSLPGLEQTPVNSSDRQRAIQLLSSARQIYLSGFFYARDIEDQEQHGEGLRSILLHTTLPPRLAALGLTLGDVRQCRLLPKRMGFYLNICPLIWQGEPPKMVSPEKAAPLPPNGRLLVQLQQQCPRIFAGDYTAWQAPNGDWRANVGDHKYAVTITPQLDVYVEHRLDVFARKILDASQANQISQMSCVDIIRGGRQYWWGANK